jgi:hypothetical protein
MKERIKRQNERKMREIKRKVKEGQIMRVIEIERERERKEETKERRVK